MFHTKYVRNYFRTFPWHYFVYNFASFYLFQALNVFLLPNHLDSISVGRACQLFFSKFDKALESPTIENLTGFCITKYMFNALLLHARNCIVF